MPLVSGFTELTKTGSGAMGSQDRTGQSWGVRVMAGAKGGVWRHVACVTPRHLLELELRITVNYSCGGWEPNRGLSWVMGSWQGFRESLVLRREEKR